MQSAAHIIHWISCLTRPSTSSSAVASKEHWSAATFWHPRSICGSSAVRHHSSGSRNAFGRSLSQTRDCPATGGRIDSQRDADPGAASPHFVCPSRCDTGRAICQRRSPYRRLRHRADACRARAYAPRRSRSHRQRPRASRNSQDRTVTYKNSQSEGRHPLTQSLYFKARRIEPPQHQQLVSLGAL